MNKALRTLAVGAAGLTLVAGVFVATAAAGPTARAGDGPAGFSYGTDSWYVSGTGSAPYKEPVIGGGYGGYIGMAGNWVREEGCHTGNFLAWSSANSAQADTNYWKYHIGIGTGVYWYMAGPGVDPQWNGTAAEASKWGALQASWTLAAMKSLNVTNPLVWADIEFPGIEPAPDNGWKDVYTGPCSWHVTGGSVPASVARAEFDAFAAYIARQSAYKVGVYSSPSVWRSIFGTGTASLIPNTYEWTYEPETSQLSAAPVGWCLRGTSSCAEFFGGQTSSSKYALMWQWSGGGGVRNGYGDFDQIDVARMSSVSLAAGYDVLTADGGVHNFHAPWYGSAAGTLGNLTAVAIATDSATGGYWILKSNGGVASYNAPWYGSLTGTNSTVTAIAADGHGYLVLTANGGVHNFGAPWYGSAAGKLGKLKAVGLAVDQQTGGYWILVSNGGVQNFNAPWQGSLGADVGFSPVTGIAAHGNGYDVLTADGGVHNFHAPWYGSAAGTLGNLTAVAIATDSATGGYWILKSNGGVASYNAPWYGSLTGTNLTVSAIGGV